VAKLIAGAAAIGAASGAGIDAGIQGIKIHITKQQKEFQLGSFLGSGVEGAIIGGAAAIPGLGTVIGIAAPIIASGAGAGANSVISQAIDEKEVNWWKTGEEVVVGLFVSGICYKLGKVLSPVKDKVSSFLGIPVRPKSTSIIKEAYGKALDALEKNTLKYRAIMAAGKTPSALTRRVRAGIQEEMDGLLKKYMKELWKVNGKRSIKSLVMTVAGYKSIKSVMGDVLRLALPLYQEEGEESLLEYIDSYMDELMSLYGEKTEICA